MFNNQILTYIYVFLITIKKELQTSKGTGTVYLNTASTSHLRKWIWGWGNKEVHDIHAYGRMHVGNERFKRNCDILGVLNVYHFQRISSCWTSVGFQWDVLTPAVGAVINGSYTRSLVAVFTKTLVDYWQNKPELPVKLSGSHIKTPKR